ncbi:phage head morphogenesis protein [Bacillus thuringiensis]|uniref:phage minor head protein n=1 Tax=Bacillus thuringiensis TaxID=1428 RepID=UPI001FAB60BE
MFPRKHVTYGERRKRLNTKLILKDMEEIESAFLTESQKLNKKRQEQLMERTKKLIPELQKAHQQGDFDEVAGLLATLQMPSHKEYKKLITKLIKTSVEAGVLRAHSELEKLQGAYSFSEDIFEQVTGHYAYEVVFPPEAQVFLENYSLEITAITEATVIDAIREVLMQGLTSGTAIKDLIQLIRECSERWLSQNHAETIARTENGKMYNAGRLARYMSPENQGFIVALQYDSIVDRRTTEICRYLDGMIISIDNASVIAEYTPPNHFKCRATWLPVSKFEEWEDNFDISMKPEKGFDFTAPLPRLLNGTNGEPLVRPKQD